MTHPPSRERVASKASPTTTEGERLSKRVARQCGCSRREAEQWIEEGKVRVDGVCIQEPPHRVALTATVEVETSITAAPAMLATLLWHKPAQAPQRADLLQTQNHMPQDPVNLPVLQRHFKGLVNHVPLEDAASGLVVWTQDWRVTRKLTENLLTMEHELLLDVQGPVDSERLQPLLRALADPQLRLPQAKISVGSSRAERSRLRLAVKGLHPGFAAYLCDLAQLRIEGLHRIRLGRVSLGGLAAGQWRYLAPFERF